MFNTRLTRLAARLPLALPFGFVSAAFLSFPLEPICSALNPGDPEPARVTLEAADKQALVATYYAPINTLEKASAVLLVHDAGGSREDLRPLAIRLQKSGFAVLALDLRGHGESATAECNWKQLDTEAQSKAWNSMPGDVKAGVDFIGNQKGVTAARVSLLANGASAELIARHAIRDERVRELVLLDPKAEVFGSSLVKELKQLADIPTLIVVGKSDLNSGKRMLDAVARSASDAGSIDVKTSKLESAQILSDKPMVGEVSRWMLEKLQPKTSPKN